MNDATARSPELSGVDHLDGQILRLRIQREFPPDGVFQADQNDLYAERRRCLHGSLDFRLGGVVSPHGVDGNRQHVCSSILLFFRNLNYFAALVLAAMWANPVGQLGLMTIRALGQNGPGQRIVRAARGSASL